MEDRQQDSFQNQEQNIAKVPSFSSADDGNLSPRIKIWGNLRLPAFLILIFVLILGLVSYRLIRSQISPIPPPITPSLVKATVTPLMVISPTLYPSRIPTDSATITSVEQDEVGETNNWRTYAYKSTSSKYPSYSIKYPAGWTYTEEFAHGTSDLRVVFSDNQGKEVLSFIGSRLDFIDDFYSMQSNYLGQLKVVNIHGRKGYVFSNKYDYITAYYFPLEEGYVSFQLLGESVREIFEQIPATLSLSR